MTEKIRIEVFVARPPTRRCRELLALIEEVVRQYPEHVRLVVFERGMPWPEQPSPRLRVVLMKNNQVPLCFVDGRGVCGYGVPSRDQVEAQLHEALSRGETRGG